MSMVSRPPGIVGDENELVRIWELDDRFFREGETYRVETKTDSVIEPIVLRKRTVSSLVGHTPPAGKYNALPVPVKCPERPFGHNSNGCRESIVLNKGSRKRVYEPAQLVYDDGANNITHHIK